MAVKEVKVKEIKKEQPATQPTAIQPKTKEAPKAVSSTNTRRYHIIIASVGTESDAHAMAEQLKQKGFSDAQAIIGDGKMRVSISSHPSEEEAYKELNNIRKNEAYQSAWVLKK